MDQEERKVYMKQYMYQKRNKSTQQKYIDRMIKLPWRCIDEAKYFTKQDYDYIESVAI